MKKYLFLSLLMLAATAVGYVKSPAMRAAVNLEWRQWSGWTNDARREDPAGFVTHVQTKLQDDLATMQQSRTNLANEAIRVAEKKNELEALKTQASSLVESFRSEWQTQSFPIIVCNAAYTKTQAESQVQLLLDQIDQYEDSVKLVANAKVQADERIRSLTLQIDRTKTSLALLDTQKELLKAEKLTSEGESLVAQVDSLLNQNEDVISGTPVRSVEELLATRKETTGVAAYWNGRVSVFLDGDAPATNPIPSNSVSPKLDAAETKGSVDGEHKAGKPVFSQF